MQYHILQKEQFRNVRISDLLPEVFSPVDTVLVYCSAADDSNKQKTLNQMEFHILAFYIIE